MVSDKLNSSPKEKIGKYEIIAQLSGFTRENGNPIVFKDFGVPDESELIKDHKIREEVLEGLNEEKIDEVKFSLEVCKSFITKPIFTDSFHENLDARNDWEEKYFFKLKELNKEAFEYGQSNRLRVNVCYSVLISLEIFSDDIKNTNLKKEFLTLKEKIPKEFKEKDENGYQKYHSLPDDEKIRVVKELTEIAKKAISLLEEK